MATLEVSTIAQPPLIGNTARFTTAVISLFQKLSAILASINGVGQISPFASQNASFGQWLLGNGSAVSRTQYSVLFAAIGTTFGIGDGSTTFNVPNIPPLVSNVNYFIYYSN